jgi:hypothetical protein
MRRIRSSILVLGLLGKLKNCFILLWEKKTDLRFEFRVLTNFWSSFLENIEKLLNSNKKKQSELLIIKKPLDDPVGFSPDISTSHRSSKRKEKSNFSTVVNYWSFISLSELPAPPKLIGYSSSSQNPIDWSSKSSKPDWLNFQPFNTWLTEIPALKHLILRVPSPKEPDWLNPQPKNLIG